MLDVADARGGWGYLVPPGNHGRIGFWPRVTTYKMDLHNNPKTDLDLKNRDFVKR